MASTLEFEQCFRMDVDCQTNSRNLLFLSALDSRFRNTHNIIKLFIIVFSFDQAINCCKNPLTNPGSLLSSMQSAANGNMYAIYIDLPGGNHKTTLEKIVQYPSHVYSTNPSSYSHIAGNICR